MLRDIPQDPKLASNPNHHPPGLHLGPLRLEADPDCHAHLGCEVSRLSVHMIGV